MDITLIGVPMDLGADRRGVDMGPSAIRYANLDEKLRALGHAVHDAGTVSVPDPATRAAGDAKLKYLDQIVTCAQVVARTVRDSIEHASIPIVLGGDHSIALGSIGGAANALGGEVGVIWMDAHGDFNTRETTPSGNIHGMILAALAGYGDPRLVHATGEGRRVDPKRVAIVGARDLDEGERGLLREAGVHVYTMTDIDRRGISDVTGEALALAGEGTRGIYLSFDLDVVDPTEAPGVGTPVPGGITYREAHLAMELVAESGRLVGMDLVEVNPILDRQNHTAMLATELALSALGKRIF